LAFAEQDSTQLEARRQTEMSRLSLAQPTAIQGTGREWMLNQKVETDVATNLVFVFVRLNNLNSPNHYVVPRADAVKYVSENHKKWLATPGRLGRAHQDNPMRKFADAENEYLDRWENLGLD